MFTPPKRTTGLLSRDPFFEAHQKQKEPHDPMWPVRFVCLHPRDAPVVLFEDEYLREVELHPLFNDMVCCRLYCRALPVLGLELVHDVGAKGPHATHNPPKGYGDD